MFPLYLYYTQPKVDMLSLEKFREQELLKTPTKQQWYDNCEELESMGVRTMSYPSTVAAFEASIPTKYFHYKIVMTDTLNTLINSRQELQEFLDNAKENNQTVLLEDDKIRELLGLRIPDEHYNWLNEK